MDFMKAKKKFKTKCVFGVLDSALQAYAKEGGLVANKPKGRTLPACRHIDSICCAVFRSVVRILPLLASGLFSTKVARNYHSWWLIEDCLQHRASCIWLQERARRHPGILGENHQPGGRLGYRPFLLRGGHAGGWRLSPEGGALPFKPKPGVLLWLHSSCSLLIVIIKLILSIYMSVLACLKA